MTLADLVRSINWQDENNRAIGEALISDAEEYMKRVVDHIYKGNEVRADRFMDFAEKQDELSRLDRKRTAAHDRMLKSFGPFLDLLKEQPGFDESGHDLSNRTRIADFVFLTAFELLGIEPSLRTEGSIRDELAEKIHKGELSYGQIRDAISEK